MNDMKELLERALADSHGPGPTHRVNAADDLARGRRLRRRRRTLGLAAAAAVAAGLAAGSLAATGAGPHPGPQAGLASTRHMAMLVAYQGRQVPGYRVAYAPRGWVIQGGNAFALTIAPKGDNDKSIASFTGKLVVMLQSRDQHGRPPGAPLRVNGRPGRFSAQGNTQILYFKLADGRWVVVQAPEHVVENLKLEEKAARDGKKTVKRQPPEKNFVNWDKNTFTRLTAAQPERLTSRFAVSHGMLLNVLSRKGDGCAAMQQLISR